MYKFVGVVVAIDHFLVPGFSEGMHQFHLVVEEDGSGDRVRLRAPGCTSIPLRLMHFGEGATLEEVSDRLALGARIEFEYVNVPIEHRNDPDFHSMDVIVPRPAEIERVFRAPRRDATVLPFGRSDRVAAT